MLCHLQFCPVACVCVRAGWVGQAGMQAGRQPGRQTGSLCWVEGGLGIGAEHLVNTACF
jgi:hypothetical protein